MVVGIFYFTICSIAFKPKYDTLVSVLENEFEKELPSPLPERLAPMLLKNKAVQSVFDKYELTDDFGASPEYFHLEVLAKVDSILVWSNLEIF